MTRLMSTKRCFLTPALLSSTSGVSHSSSSSSTVGHVPHGHTTPPLPPHAQREHSTLPPPPPPPHHTIPRSSPHPRPIRTIPSSPHSEVNRDSLPPHTRLLLAPSRRGCIPGPRPKAADYEDGVEKMLLNAMHEYACLILTTDAFPNEVRQKEWAKATWRTACDEVGVHYECSVRMIRLVRLQHSSDQRTIC
jgi:uncharacterized protein DUF6532